MFMAYSTTMAAVGEGGQSVKRFLQLASVSMPLASGVIFLKRACNRLDYMMLKRQILYTYMHELFTVSMQLCVFNFKHKIDNSLNCRGVTHTI